MNYGVHNNLALMNANRQLKISTGSKAKSAEKLSTGYRINRSADDAAGLAISEKMRLQIRGLNRGTLNGEEGVSWIQTGDGALEEVHALLHRMRELTIQSLNDTNTEADRAACQAEFDQLQSEVDRITKNTQFNTQEIFDEHDLPYYQCEGNANWNQGQKHVIGSDNNDLIIYYRESETDAQKQVSFTVPEGTYTTQELIDEMEDAIIAAGLDEEGIVFEYTENHACNLNLEGGEMIDAVGGGLSYLLYDMYTGGGFGALVGTTTFLSEYSRLEIGSENNNMSFSIESFDGTQSQTVNLTIPDGRYTRQELIDILNTKLQGTDVTATKYGSGIKLAGENSIVTGFKGNMFKIDEGLDIYHSVFYDNIKYGNVQMGEGYFNGGTVKSTDRLSSEYEDFVIEAGKNELVFTSNGADTPVTITIPPKTYTFDEMIAELNNQFAAAGLELNAEPRVDGNYKGITIRSKVIGITSKVGLSQDTSVSTAFETLFKKRVYNATVETEKNVYDRSPDKLATLSGKKQFTGSNVPFVVTQGDNDQFYLTLTENNNTTNQYLITLDEAADPAGYASVDEIVANINSKLTDLGIDGRLEAKASGGTVQLVAKTGSGLKGISVSEVTDNDGYDNIFVKTTVSYSTTQIKQTGTSSSPAVVELPKDIADPTQFDSTNNKLHVNINGATYEIEIPTDAPQTHDDLVDLINDKLKEEVTTAPNTFTAVDATGQTDTKYSTRDDVGGVKEYAGVYSNNGTSDVIQGTVGGIANNVPAKITMNCPVPSAISVDDSSNVFYLTINGVKKQLVLDSPAVYTKNNIVNTLQKLIDNAFGTSYGGAIVSMDGNGVLSFTARLNYPDGTVAEGRDTSIACNKNESSFLKKLHMEEDAATITSKEALQVPTTIETGKNTLVFDYRDGDNPATQTVTLNLTPGTYTSRQSIVDEINKQLTKGGYGVTASLSGNQLCLTTKDIGTDTYICFKTASGGSAVESLFGPMVTEKPASGTANQVLQDEITIDNSNNTMKVWVNGNPQTITLANGTYTNKLAFAEMVDQALDGTGLNASLDTAGKRLTYTTDAVGSSASLRVDYFDSPAAMLAMYGETTTIKPGATASFNGDKLVLTGTRNNGSITVSSGNGDSMFVDRTENVSKEGPTGQQGYSSTTYAYIDGASLAVSPTTNSPLPISITDLNNKLKFSYVDAGSTKTADITLTTGDYATYDDLKDALQNAIDNSPIGPNELTVSVDATGVRIEANEPGSTHYLTGFSGGFYDRVLRRIAKYETNLSVKEVEGSQNNDNLAYAIGRQVIKDKETVIRKDINDTLSLDFTYGTNKQTFTIELDPGTYSDDSLVDEIQKKLDEEVKKAGLEEGIIEVGIGGVSSGVSGSHDADALVFKLSDSVRLPGNGTYIIDGVSGNAAFSIFYETDGELEPAYIGGSKDITNGVTVKTGENELSFLVDGTDRYTLTLQEGDYATAQELIDEMNKQLSSSGAPVFAEAYKDTVRLVYATMGKHSITEVSGSAKEEIFFQENGEVGDRTGVMIQLSSNKGSSLEIDRPIVNTAYLGINSVAITRPKYANKALTRLDDALARVSEIRSTFGALQNRLEHAIANNENTSENTQAAESRLRDTDMADEMVNQAKYNILQQVTESLMAQEKVSAEGVLRLLQ